MLADAAIAAAAATIEGVPPWVTYVGGAAGTLIVAPVVAVLVRALARKLGVADDTSSPTTTPTSEVPPIPPSTMTEDERELNELRAALADVLVDLRRARALAAEERAARERAEERAERLQQLLETMSARLNREPPA